MSRYLSVLKGFSGPRDMCGAKREKGRLPDIHDGHGIVVKDGGNVFRGEFVGGVAYEQACFPNGTVTDHNASVTEE